MLSAGQRWAVDPGNYAMLAFGASLLVGTSGIAAAAVF
jgi:hypothetical protein